ncbi:MAG: hypothetical protein R2752_20770 [Vicinamibacterales bacterium]
MRTTRVLPLLMFFALAAPGVARGQSPWNRGPVTPATSEGYTRGQRAGDEDARRGQSYDYRDEADYRRGDAGYRSQYGSRDRYRDEFRRAYADGYDAGWRGGRGSDPYGRPGTYDPYGGYGRPGAGRAGGPGGVRNDLAFRTGTNDGYEAGLDDGRDGRRFDPIGERRYRSGDHGYDRRYGSKDLWKVRYREGFKLGYEQGYQDARRYGRGYDGRRYDPRDRRPDRPWWWPW